MEAVAVVDVDGEGFQEGKGVEGLLFFSSALVQLLWQCPRAELMKEEAVVDWLWGGRHW